MDFCLTRREFISLWGLALGSFVAQPLRNWLPPEDQGEFLGMGRVTRDVIGLYAEPSYESTRLRWITRDRLVGIVDEVTSKHGPKHNPRWYRLVGGYAHSAYIQRVDRASLNPVLPSIPPGGQLGEVTVPFVQSLRLTRTSDWHPLYRLYFGSIYWITGLIEGPDGQPWYELTDDRLRIVYCVPAATIRPITAEEISPLSTQVPPEDKRIEVSLREQRLRAYERDRLVFEAPISTGVKSTRPPPNGIPTETPEGNFRISVKTPSRHMGNGELTSEINAYELPGVPWVCFFHAVGVGFHGTYWHDNFGTPMSHGCVNMRNEDSKWLYRWSTPTIEHHEWYTRGSGTLVQVA